MPTKLWVSTAFYLFSKSKIELQIYNHTINKEHVNKFALHLPPVIHLQTNKMTPFNKNVSPLLLLALFIIVTTFSMNVEASTMLIYNNVTQPGQNLTATCGTIKGDAPPYEITLNEKYTVISDELDVICHFKWPGGFLDSLLIFRKGTYPCDICLWIFKSYGACYQRADGTEACSKYNS